MSLFQLTILCHLVIDSLHYDGTGCDHVFAAIDMIEAHQSGKMIFRKILDERNFETDSYAGKYVIAKLLK